MAPKSAKEFDSAQLRNFTPLNKLSQEDSKELLRTAIIVNRRAGSPIFHEDSNSQIYYLVSGEIDLTAKPGQKRRLVAGSEEARSPIKSNRQSAIAATDTVLLSFDIDMLKLFLSWTGNNVAEKPPKVTNEEWLDKLLQSRGLLRFSDEHIQRLLDRMSEVHFKAGEVIINQDDNDDYYYIVKDGRCSVSRKPSPSSDSISLAELKEGDAFGEEALLSSARRSATVIMKEEGNLMRLSKSDFSELLAEPLLSSVDLHEAKTLSTSGAVFIDIRQPDEFNANHIPGSINIPLSVLRIKMKHLSHHNKYIIYCDDGNRSTVAAFLLNRHGFDAFVLDGGVAAAHSIAPNSHIEQTSAAPQGKAYSSLADFWGSTVDDGPRTSHSFGDDTKSHDTEKTKPVINKKVPVKPAAAAPTTPTTPTTRRPKEVAVTAGTQKIMQQRAAKQTAPGLDIRTIGKRALIVLGVAAFTYVGITRFAFQPEPEKPTMTEAKVQQPTHIAQPKPKIVKQTVPTTKVSPEPRVVAQPETTTVEISTTETPIFSPFDAPQDTDNSYDESTSLIEPQPTQQTIAAPKKVEAIDPATRGFLPTE